MPVAGDADPASGAREVRRLLAVPRGTAQIHRALAAGARPAGWAAGRRDGVRVRRRGGVAAVCHPVCADGRGLRVINVTCDREPQIGATQRVVRVAVLVFAGSPEASLNLRAWSRRARRVRLWLGAPSAGARQDTGRRQLCVNRLPEKSHELLERRPRKSSENCLSCRQLAWNRLTNSYLIDVDGTRRAEPACSTGRQFGSDGRRTPGLE